MTLYEIKSGLMGFYLFEQMIYSQEDAYKAPTETFLKIITDKNKTETLPEKFTQVMKDRYAIEMDINTEFTEARLVWRGACDAKAKKTNKNEPLEVKFNISDGHTDVKFNVGSGIDIPRPPVSSSLPGFLQRALYSSSDSVEYDNFECQHWLWLLPNVLFDDETVIKKEWRNNKYEISTVGSQVNIPTIFACYLYDERLIANPDWDLPKGVDYLEYISLCIKRSHEVLLRKLLPIVDKKQLLDALTKVDEYQDCSLMNSVSKSPNLLRTITEAFNDNKNMLPELFSRACDRKNGYTPLYLAFRDSDSFKLILDTFKNDPKRLTELLLKEDLYKSPVLDRLVEVKSDLLQPILETLEYRSDLVEKLLKDIFYRGDIYRVASNYNVLNFIIKMFKDKPALLKELFVMNDRYYTKTWNFINSDQRIEIEKIINGK